MATPSSVWCPLRRVRYVSKLRFMTSHLYRTDNELIEACLADDAAAWEKFMTQYRRLIRSTTAQLRRRYEVASIDTDDLEHHIYQKLLEDDRRRIRSWKGRARFSTYLVQVTRNLVMDYYALRNKGPLAEEYEASAGDRSVEYDAGEEEEQSQRRAAFDTALKALPEKQALLIRLRLEGKTLNEIAEITRRPLGTISVENSRALARLRAGILALMNEQDDHE